MKTVRLGINGFGRIGRLITRSAQDFDNIEIVAINDPFLTPDYAKYLSDAQEIESLYLLGRLANYKYINMDIAVLDAINLVNDITK